MTNTENEPTFPRDHSHCMDRTGVNYVACTSLTHCPSICDCPVSECTAAAAELATNDDLDHCEACGFDCGTHRPGCLRAYGSANFNNPNRPTIKGYCAQGNHPLQFHFRAECYAIPRPLTAYEQGIRDRAATVEGLTPDQMSTALLYLSGARDNWETGNADPRWTNAIAYALNPKR